MEDVEIKFEATSDVSQSDFKEENVFDASLSFGSSEFGDKIQTPSKQDGVKKKRSANFGDAEVDTLISLVEKYKNVLESKKSNAVTWKAKEKMWARLAAEFSAISGIAREARVLKSKFESLKKLTRRKTTQIRQELITSGGKPGLTNLTPMEERIQAIILLSCEGVPVEFDCDAESTGDNTEVQEDEDPLRTEKDEIEEVEEMSSINSALIEPSQESQCYKPGSSKGDQTSDDQTEGDSWNPETLRPNRVAPLRPNKWQSNNHKKGTIRVAHRKYEELLDIRIEESKARLKREAEEHTSKMEEHALRMQILHTELRIKEAALEKMLGEK